MVILAAFLLFPYLNILNEFSVIRKNPMATKHTTAREIIIEIITIHLYSLIIRLLHQLHYIPLP